MTRFEYIAELNKLMRENHGDENAPDIIALNVRYQTAMRVAQAGGEEMIDASNQGSQGSMEQRHVAGLNLSDSQIMELKWANDREELNNSLDAAAHNVANIKKEFGMK